MERFVTKGDKGVKLSKVISWKNHLTDDDIRAASEYLNLNMPRHLSEEATKLFLKHRDRIEWYRAKDIIRSSKLNPLPRENQTVGHKINKIQNGEKLNPILLVRHNNRLIVADGYHRLSAVYNTDESERVACVLVSVK